MGIPESQLKTWSHQGSVAQSRATYETVKKVLESKGANYANKPFEVFLQGSYGNDTNIYGESDVDVVIRLDSMNYYNIDRLTAQETAAFKAAVIPVTYPYAQYQADVLDVVRKAFGSDVKVGTKAVKVKANGSRRDADVVVATQFRRYYSGQTPLSYAQGISFKAANGGLIENFPKQHTANCTSKNQATNGWFKPMVRVLKNMRSKLVADGVIPDGCAPSYFIEGLLYNVPKEKFGTSYGDIFVAALNWVVKEADRTQLVCANGFHWLARDDRTTSWPVTNCDTFINEVVGLWNKW